MMVADSASTLTRSQPESGESPGSNQVPLFTTVSALARRADGCAASPRISSKRSGDDERLVVSRFACNDISCNGSTVGAPSSIRSGISEGGDGVLPTEDLIEFREYPDLLVASMLFAPFRCLEEERGEVCIEFSI